MAVLVDVTWLVAGVRVVFARLHVNRGRRLVSVSMGIEVAWHMPFVVVMRTWLLGGLLVHDELLKRLGASS